MKTDLTRRPRRDPEFYSLIFTNDTVENTDNQIINPTSVSYDPQLNKAVLSFATDLDSLPTGTGTYRLRIGTDDALPGVPKFEPVANDPGSSFATAYDAGILGPAVVLSSAIEPQDYPLQYPGAISEPGHRDVSAESHYNASADATAGISIQEYNFKSNYGEDPQGNPLFNLITAEQKERSREIFELYGHYLGIQFVETAASGFTIATGDLRALDPDVNVDGGAGTGGRQSGHHGQLGLVG